MATPAQVLSTVRNQIAEVSAEYFTDAEISSYMWQGECVIAKQLGCYQSTSATTSTAVGTREYALPTNSMSVYRVTWDSFPLTKISLADIDATEGAAYAYTGSQGSPIYYYEDGVNVGLSPIPNAVKVLKFWYTKEPAEVTTTSTAFSIPGIFTFYLADYCLYRMYEKDQDAERARFHLDSWNNNLLMANSEWRKMNKVNKRVLVKDWSVLPDNNLRIG